MEEKFGRGIMVIGAVSKGFKSEIRLCSAHEDAAEYQALVVNASIVERANSLYGVSNWHWMQDGAPAHTAQSTIDFLTPEMQILAGWPANSPDLNPIEMLWSIIGHRLAGKEFATLDALFAEVKRIWDQLDQGMIDRLVDDFWRRCDLVIACNGSSISQLLSSHMTAPRPQDIATHLVVTQFSQEVDAHILEFIDEAPRRQGKWLRLHESLPDFSPQALKRRYAQLQQEAANLEWAETRAAFILADPDVVEVFEHNVALDDDDEEDEDDAELADRGGQLWLGEAPAAPPVQALTGYVGFCKARAATLARIALADRARVCGALWRALPDEEKLAYQSARRPPVPSGKKGRGRPKKKP
jgi:hypothetical protein